MPATYVVSVAIVQHVWIGPSTEVSHYHCPQEPGGAEVGSDDRFSFAIRGQPEGSMLAVITAWPCDAELDALTPEKHKE
jgi:hypothetical protein